jgi:glucose/arabinose dehydrogenase
MTISRGILVATALALAGVGPAADASVHTGSSTGEVRSVEVAAGDSGGSDPDAVERAPRLRVRTAVRRVDIPWDLTFLPSGAMLFTERDRERIWWRGPEGRRRVVAATPRGVWHSGETGLMSILAARSFARTRHFFTCHGVTRSNGHAIRVVRWRLNGRATHARRVETIVPHLPTRSGRHGGCRLRFGAGGALYIGTGDAAVGSNPQNLRSGGGKVLRVRPRTGAGWPSNPFADADHPMKRRIYTYGHRNVQGLALRADGRMWSVEHGTYRDDEVNRLRKGGNYGWNPVPGYDETTPMTDFSLPGRQIGARWRSGDPTIATSGATWLRGQRWGRWEGCLAVATLADESLRIMRFRANGDFVRMWRPAALNGEYGRLRSVVLGPGNALYVTTANGGGRDRILRVAPRA